MLMVITYRLWDAHGSLSSLIYRAKHCLHILQSFPPRQFSGPAKPYKYQLERHSQMKSNTDISLHTFQEDHQGLSIHQSP